jgi:hypothetical protein
MKTWKARIRLSNGSQIETTVNAKSWSDAKALFEQTYGRGSVITGPTEVR